MALLEEDLKFMHIEETTFKVALECEVVLKWTFKEREIGMLDSTVHWGCVESTIGVSQDKGNFLIT